MRIAICIITFQRPQMLRTLLRSLGALVFDGVDPPEIEIVVVDNDTHGGAAAVCADLADSLPWPIRCDVEPKRGIPFARNRSVSIALDAGADAVVFIDDDERATPTWLMELIRVQMAHAADVVAGPVVREFPVDAPAWTRRSTVFNRPRHATGSRRPFADTGNNLTMRSVLQRFTPPFDESIGRGGGSDRAFYAKVADSGGIIIWADDAVVYEPVPHERLTMGWVLRRGLHGGNQLVWNARSCGAWNARVAAGFMLRAGMGFLRGALLLPLTVVQGRAALARALWHWCNSTGVIAGLCGRRMTQYEASGEAKIGA